MPEQQPDRAVVQIVPAAMGPESAADYIGISRAAFFKLIQTGAIPKKKFGARTLIMREDLDAWLASLQYEQRS